MVPMGRPRTHRKDLPPGLHVDRWGTYFYRPTKGATRGYVTIGKVEREAAIRRWLELTATPLDDAPAGTVAELIDRYLRDELRGLSPATVTNYKFHCGKLRDRWGSRKYAQEAAEAARGGALRRQDVYLYLRDAKAAGKGYFSACYAVGVLQNVFARAGDWGLTEYNPCVGVVRETPAKITRLPTFEQIIAAQNNPKASERMRLMVELAWRTGMRQTDVRNLQIHQVKADLQVIQSKTGMEQDWELTPELVALFARAAKLPGRSRSLYVFPRDSGKPVTLDGFQSEWRRMAPGFQFRAIRKWAINQKIAAGENAQEFAGHHDARTTRRHYDLTPRKVQPLKGEKF